MADAEADLAGPVALGIMCKEPLPGANKTRLSPPLSPEEAAALSRCFVADVASVVADMPQALDVRGFLVFTPSGAHRAFDGLMPSGFRMLAQRGEDLSERCACAVEDMLSQGCAAACLLNADSPTLPRSTLEAAVEALRRPGERVVLGPALDGGFYLVGVRRSLPELFRGVGWSTGRALADAETRASELGLTIERLATWYDVDDGLSLVWLLQELLGEGRPPVANGLLGSPAPRTRAYLSALVARGDGPPLSVLSTGVGGVIEG